MSLQETKPAAGEPTQTTGKGCALSRACAWAPLVLWMGVIFIASTDLMSSAHTSRFIGPFLHWLKPDISTRAVEVIQMIVRKGGHVTEYTILALLFWRARRTTATGQARAWSGREAGITVAFGCFYAMSDEFHQHFVASREASVRDVMLDTLGAAVGAAIIWAGDRFRRRG